MYQDVHDTSYQTDEHSFQMEAAMEAATVMRAGGLAP